MKYDFNCNDESFFLSKMSKTKRENKIIFHIKSFELKHDTIFLPFDLNIDFKII